MRPEILGKLKISPYWVSNPRPSELEANDLSSKLPRGTNFCQRLSKPQGFVRPEKLRKLKISTNWVSNPRPSDLMANNLTTKLPPGSHF
jgi:hypothetical protein